MSKFIICHMLFLSFHLPGVDGIYAAVYRMVPLSEHHDWWYKSHLLFAVRGKIRSPGLRVYYLFNEVYVNLMRPKNSSSNSPYLVKLIILFFILHKDRLVFKTECKFAEIV